MWMGIGDNREGKGMDRMGVPMSFTFACVCGW